MKVKSVIHRTKHDNRPRRPLPAEPEMIELKRMIRDGELDQARTVAQVHAEAEIPETRCPACGKWIPDLDGFGVLAHTGPDGCGYCSHPSRTGRTCDICGHVTGEGDS